MPSPVIKSEAVCTHCGNLLSESLRHCPTCQTDAGAPNVRACLTQENMKSLKRRFDYAKTQATDKKCSKEFSKLSKLIKDESGVVIAMPAGVARDLVDDTKELYVNYEKLVGSNVRKPAGPESDRQRSVVGGMIFGTYANNIIYGALSLTTKGLPTYGEVYCRLRNKTIENRTSLLETNSFKFVEDHDIRSDGGFPGGYRASWEHRYMLVLAKLADRLMKDQTRENWQELLIVSNGQDRKADDFVEAHIFEGFDRNAIESMVISTDKKLSRENKVDMEIALEKFSKLCEKTK